MLLLVGVNIMLIIRIMLVNKRDAIFTIKDKYYQQVIATSAMVYYLNYEN